MKQPATKKKESSTKKEEVLTRKDQEELLSQFPWKKDLKIKGQIGGPNEKGKLNFISVIRKMERALNQGYKDPEVCEAVIEMISPEQKLRSLLEGKWDATLPKLRRFLRCHFKEEEATKMFHQLSNMSQSEKMTPEDFVQDVIVLRDKILFTSKEAESEFLYSEELVQKQCQHAIVTGLRNDNIKAEVKMAMGSRFLEDEELLELVNKSVSDEKERQRKLKSSSTAKVNMVEEKKESEEKKETRTSKVNPIVVELQEIKAAMSQLSTLQNDVEGLKECVRNICGTNNPNGLNTGGGNKVRFGCQACRQQNIRGCNHCFKCGNAGNSKANCPN